MKKSMAKKAEADKPIQNFLKISITKAKTEKHEQGRVKINRENFFWNLITWVTGRN